MDFIQQNWETILTIINFIGLSIFGMKKKA